MLRASRYPNGADDTTGGIASQTTRGFTGEEELSAGGLVHLNGRVYDPLLARMTSADPTVTDPMNPQGWNRCSYVGNDPLAFTDPNGYSWSSFWHNVTSFFSNSIVHVIVQIIAAVVIAAILAPAVFAGALASSTAAFASAAGSAAISTGLAGGNLGQILRASAIAGATAFAFFEVGGLTNAVAGVDPSAAHVQPAFGTDAYAFNVAGHALVGCASSVASGALVNRARCRPASAPAPGRSSTARTKRRPWSETPSLAVSPPSPAAASSPMAQLPVRSGISLTALLGEPTDM